MGDLRRGRAWREGETGVQGGRSKGGKFEVVEKWIRQSRNLAQEERRKNEKRGGACETRGVEWRWKREVARRGEVEKEAGWWGGGEGGGVEGRWSEGGVEWRWKKRDEIRLLHSVMTQLSLIHVPPPPAPTCCLHHHHLHLHLALPAFTCLLEPASDCLHLPSPWM